MTVLYSLLHKIDRNFRNMHKLTKWLLETIILSAKCYHVICCDYFIISENYWGLISVFPLETLYVSVWFQKMNLNALSISHELIMITWYWFLICFKYSENWCFWKTKLISFPWYCNYLKFIFDWNYDMMIHNHGSSSKFIQNESLCLEERLFIWNLGNRDPNRIKHSHIMSQVRIDENRKKNKDYHSLFFWKHLFLSRWNEWIWNFQPSLTSLS